MTKPNGNETDYSLKTALQESNLRMANTAPKADWVCVPPIDRSWRGRRASLPQVVRHRGEVPVYIAQKINSVLCGAESWPIFFHGIVGDGKTCTALLLLDIIADTVTYLTVNDMVSQLTEAFRPNGVRAFGEEGLSPEQWWSRIARTGCVCLDELGNRSTPSAAEYDWVKRLIEEQWKRQSPLILISNLDLNGLAKVYDDRIASRISAGTVIKFPDVDLRQRTGGSDA